MKPSIERGAGVAGRAAVRIGCIVLASSLLGACIVEPPSYYQPGGGYSGGAPGYAPNAEVGVGADAGGGQVYVQASIAPPPLPVYAQPPCPAYGYLWTPGYWAYGPGGYFWVPGTWVMPPEVGLLWTPGYWGWSGGLYLFHDGYWGRRVGFYGGVDYGGGYFGAGFVGGRWDRDQFEYNRAVVNVNVNVVHNTYYNDTVINRGEIDRRAMNERVSYMGGHGGLRAAPTPAERLAERGAHVGRTPLQAAQVRAASQDRAQFARFNGGRPPVAATPRPQAFDSPQVERARGAVVAPRAGARREFPAPRSYPVQRNFAQPARPYPAAPRAVYGRPAVPAPYRPVERARGMPQRATTYPPRPAYRPPAYRPPVYRRPAAPARKAVPRKPPPPGKRRREGGGPG